MELLMTTENIADSDRFLFYREAYLRDSSPADAYCDQTRDFSGRFHAGDLGGISFVRTVSQSKGHSGLRRDARLIRRSDPNGYRLILNQRGLTTLAHKDNKADLESGDIALIDTSHPLHGWREPGECQLLILGFPREALPVPQAAAAKLLGARLCGRAGIGALLWTAVVRASHDFSSYSPADAIRISGTLLDLIGGLIAHELETDGLLSADSRRRLLIQEIQGFIEQRLGDTDLTLAMIAQAHHISLRSMHRLFESQSWTVAEWIRAQRLNRCRRDLADPSCGDRSIRAIAARWGLTTPHFTRVFRAAYGMSPQEYRHAGRTRRLPPA
jgi:AraC-like DNA-binding protein